MIVAGLAGIALVEIWHRKIKPKYVPDTGVSTSEFAEKYRTSRERARSGDARSAEFIQSANRRLREIRDRVSLTQSDDDRRFLLELARLGVTEKDYLK
jgi:hypothetical protein